MHDRIRATRRAVLAAVAAAIAVPAVVAPAAAQPIRASYYGAESGRVTASGAPFRAMGRTAAHPAWPFGTVFVACFVRCARGIVTDRGPSRASGRGIDLSRGLARAIGLERAGVATIDVRVTGLPSR